MNCNWPHVTVYAGSSFNLVRVLHAFAVPAAAVVVVVVVVVVIIVVVAAAAAAAAAATSTGMPRRLLRRLGYPDALRRPPPPVAWCLPCPGKVLFWASVRSGVAGVPPVLVLVLVLVLGTLPPVCVCTRCSARRVCSRLLNSSIASSVVSRRRD